MFPFLFIYIKVLPLQNAMKKPQHFSHNFGVLNIGMTIVTTILIVVGFCGYLKYGEQVEGSLTLNLPDGSMLILDFFFNKIYFLITNDI